MVIMYEDMRAEIVMDSMALSATLEPMLIRDMRMDMARETRTAFRGMFIPGLTCVERNLCQLAADLLGAR
jgi:hypothetical protein